MRRTLLLVAAVVLAFSTGCVVRSLHGIATANNTIFEPLLVGHFEDPKTHETFSFAQDDDEPRYVLVYVDEDGKSGKFGVELVQLNNRLFLDLTPMDVDFNQADFYLYHLLPVHSFVSVDALGDSLSMRGLDVDWFRDYLPAHPDELAYTMIDSDPVITASPEEIQAFVLRHLDDTEAYYETETYYRMK